MSKADEKSNQYREYRENCGIKDPVMLDEIEESYFQGYEQAEKDLALTIEDIEKIHTFLYAIENNKHGIFTFTRLSDVQYQVILNQIGKSKIIPK